MLKISTYEYLLGLSENRTVFLDNFDQLLIPKIISYCFLIPEKRSKTSYSHLAQFQAGPRAQIHIFTIGKTRTCDVPTCLLRTERCKINPRLNPCLPSVFSFVLLLSKNERRKEEGCNCIHDYK
jgi:hypothetical protein